MLKRPAIWAWAVGLCLLGLAMAVAAETGEKKEADTTKQSKETVSSSKSAERAKKNPLAGCTLCHVDVEDEYFESVHFREKVACTECHGPSKEHLADENNEVKPDQLFARKDTDRLCGECHDCSRSIPPGWTDLPLERRQVCSECHGAHEFPERVVQKQTKPPAGK